jgi:hypothetical protein
MPTGDVNSHPSENDDRFAVGWQRLTREEFLEAITAALLDRVPRHELEQSEKASLFSDVHAE